MIDIWYDIFSNHDPVSSTMLAIRGSVLSDIEVAKGFNSSDDEDTD